MFQDFVTIAKRFRMAGYPYTESFGSIGALSKKGLSQDPGEEEEETDVFSSIDLFCDQTCLRFAICHISFVS